MSISIGATVGQTLHGIGKDIANSFDKLGDKIRNAFTQDSPFKGLQQVSSGNSVAGGQALEQEGGRTERKTSLLDRLKAFFAPPPTHYESLSMPTGAGDLAQIKENAQLANYPYHRDMGRLPEGWMPSNRLTSDVAEGMGLTSQKGVEFRDGTLIDHKSGLTATVLVNPKTQDVVVSFGGTSSGKKVGETLMERSVPGKNVMTSLSQWGTNFKAGLGGVPQSYKQASELVSRIMDKVQTMPEYAGFTVRTVGHSKGGGEAMFAALRQDTPVQATTFCPSHLSDGLLKHIPDENLARSKDLVQSFSPFGDPVSALRGTLPGITGVGQGFHFDGIRGSNPVDLHDQFLKHVEHHCTAP